MNDSVIDNQRSNVETAVDRENYIVFVNDLDAGNTESATPSTWEIAEISHHPAGISQRPGLIGKIPVKVAALGLLGVSLAILSLIVWLC